MASKQKRVNVVYVDDMKARYRGMIMCHMIAGDTDELIQMADKINLQRRWIQKKGTPEEHFDVCMSKRALAVRLGAQEVTGRRLVEEIRKKREKATKK